MAQAGPKATVAIAGSSGLIGSALAAALRAADHPVLRIVRRTPANSEELHWNPDSGGFDADALPDVDAVVNLLRARGSHCATVTGVEHVIPDFNGERSRLAEVLESRPAVLAHNAETVESQGNYRPA